MALKEWRLYSMIALSGVGFGAGVVASHITQSLMLLTSTYHMLYNIMSLLLLVISHRMTKEKTLKNTFGWARVEVLGTLVNVLFLAALCFASSVEAIQTMVHAAHEDTQPRYPLLLLILGLLSLALNLLCFVLIGGYTHHQGCYLSIQGTEVQVNFVLGDSSSGGEICTQSGLNQKSAHRRANSSIVSSDHRLLDISRDISSCLGVIACAALLLLLNDLLLKYVDAILTLASVTVLLATSYPFIRESGLILLQSIPSHVDVDGLRVRLLKEFPAIQNVHDLHVWRLTATEVIATVHLILLSPSIYSVIASGLVEFFKREGITLVTIQPEFTKVQWLGQESECILQCSTNNNCGALTCCGPLLEREKQTVRQRGPIGEHVTGNCGFPPSAVTSSIADGASDLLLVSKYDFERIPVTEETEV